MKKRLPSLGKAVSIDAHGANKLSQTWFQTLQNASPTDDEILIGIDEAGRGPIFGPMVVGGSANLTGWFLPGIKDSKQIKEEATRKALASEIQHNTIWATAVISVECINRFGTIVSLREAGRQVAAEMVARVQRHCPGRRVRVVFDGRDHASRTEGICRYESIEKADATIFEVSCASIIAKVLHDNLIHEIVKSDVKYQCYDLDNSKGYGTPKHKAALLQFGKTDQHRNEAYNTFLGLTDGKTREAAGQRHTKEVQTA